MSTVNKTFGESFGHTFGSGFFELSTGGIEQPIIKFWAAWADAAGVAQPLLTGTGPVTTDHAETFYAEDHEGVYRSVATDEPVWKGGRVVDVVDFGYTLTAYGANPPVVSDAGSDGMMVVYPAGGAVGASACAARGGNFDTTVLGGGGSSISRVEVKLSRPLVGSEAIQINPTQNTHVTFIDIDSTSPDLSSFTVLSSNKQNITATSASTKFNIYVSVVLLTPCTVWVKEWQTESSTGRSDTTTPSEYIKTESTLVQKVFNYANGNTVDGNGVVTEAKGAAFADEPYLVAQDDGTNLLPDSNDFSAWTTTATIAQDVTDLEGTPNGAYSLEDTSTSVNEDAFNSVSGITGSTVVYKVWVTKDNDETRFPEFYTYLNGAVTNNYNVQINTKTGATIVRTQGLAGNRHDAIDAGNNWLVILELDNSASNTGVNLRLRPAGTTTWGATQIAALGKTSFPQVEIYDGLTIEQAKSLGPIFTEGAAASTSELRNVYPAANHSNTEGPYYLEFENTGDDVVLMKAGTDEFLKIEDGGSGADLTSYPISVLPSDWNDNGDNTYTVSTGTSTDGKFDLTALTLGNLYFIEVEITDYTSGSIGVHNSVGSFQYGSIIYWTSSGTHTITLEATSSTIADALVLHGLLFRGTVQILGVKEVDGKYLKLTDETTQLQAACAAGEHKAGVAFAESRGDELVTNGAFDTDTSNWVAEAAILSQTDYDGRSNVLSVADNGSYTQAKQALDTVIGRIYSITGLGHSINLPTHAYVIVHDGDLEGSTAAQGDILATTDGFLVQSSDWEEFSFTFTALSTKTTIGIGGSGVATAYFDNVSVKEVTNKMNLNLDDSWETQAAYDGTLGSGDISLGETSRNVRRYNETVFAKQKSKIDRLM